MRRKSEPMIQFSFFEDDKLVSKVVREYRSEYRKISTRLSHLPELTNTVHKDLLNLNSSNKGRNSLFTSESLFRALIVKQKEGIDYREASIRISESEFLQEFCLFSKKVGIDHTTLCKAFNAISPDTWEDINQQLAIQCIENKEIAVDVIRTDSTVVESNIHWPTDSSLLWDVYRVISNTLNKIRKLNLGIIPYRFHDKKIKSLHIFVTRYASSKNKKRQRQVLNKMKKLIKRVSSAISNAEIIVKTLGKAELPPAAVELQSKLPLMQKVLSCASRRWILREQVPISEKIFSIFEPHAELIMRGRREKPVEFGHKIVINQAKDKFITGYQVLEHKVDDSALLESVIDQHEMQYGTKPKALAADQGFSPDSETLEELSEDIEYLEIPRRSRDYSNSLLKSAQQFRAGIEGTISCLKRAFRLVRCYFKGFKNFSSAIGSGIFCHNLSILAKQTI